MDGRKADCRENAPSVLFLEDDPLGRWTHSRMLEQMGCNVLKATTCAEAAELWAASDIDYAVMDYRLPDGNAVELLRQMRALGHSQPVICITAEPQAISGGCRTGLGIGAVLSKPVDPTAFRAQVMGMLEKGARSCRDPLVDAHGDKCSSRAGRFRLVVCPEQVDADCAAAMEQRYLDDDWLALDMSSTVAVDGDAADVLVSMADARRGWNGRFCVVAAPGTLPRSIVVRMNDACIDIVENVESLGSLGRRLHSNCERSALTGSPVG